MPSPAPGSKQYFLGVGGQQTGPHTEDQLVSQIREGAVPRDAMIWFDGLGEWQAITSIDFFREAFDSENSILAPMNEPATAPTPGGLPFKPLAMDAGSEADTVAPRASVAEAFAPLRSQQAGPPPYTFASGASEMKPIFQKKNGRAPTGGIKIKVFHAWIGVGVLVLASITWFVVGEGSQALLGAKETIAPSMPLQPRLKFKSNDSSREGQTKRAANNLLLNTQESLKALTEIAVQNPTDKAGKDAINAVVNHYRAKQHNQETGKFLMSVKQYEEAAKYFLLPPAAPLEAEQALISAYQMTKEGHRREVLIQDIQLLLGPLNNIPTAVERIKLLETDFPNEPHNFHFYLKNADQKIADIFQRISAYFVQNLVSLVESEFPQLNFAGRPLVEIRREAGGRYRIVGSYKGTVALNQDQLRGIYFVFWLIQDTWYLVDTNLTTERAKFAKAEKARHKHDVLSANEMLTYVQHVFRTQFPKNLLHEAVTFVPSQVKPMR